MKTTLHARHLELDERLKAQVERKFRRLDRVTDDSARATIELTPRASRVADAAYLAEITLVMSGATLRSSSTGATPMVALDGVIDKLERQVVRTRQRRREPRRGSTAPPQARRVVTARSAEPGGSGEAEAAREVVEISRVDMLPMFPEDAIARMEEEAGLAFFVFLNASTGRVNVVYRRAAGGYGLIDPVVASP